MRVRDSSWDCSNDEADCSVSQVVGILMVYNASSYLCSKTVCMSACLELCEYRFSPLQQTEQTALL